MPPTKGSILAVDDEPKILEAISSFLESKGYAVFAAKTGKEALEILQGRAISLIILDLMLPDIPGEDLCRQIRRESRVPIVMLTAKSAEENLLEGLQIGADDYIVKPFGLKELHARVEAVLRRAGGDISALNAKSVFNGGDLIVDFENGAVFKRSDQVALTPSEMKIFFALIKYPNRVFSRAELIDIAFEDDFDAFDRVIDSHIKNIRRKIGDSPKNPLYITTIHGMGYRFNGR
ncbi:MAG: response regulator transcription factor [Helicobacteraceae bacterium]|jgi:DNA-binding response OmpR family regulator|nr:response regulator transcription factor [Helicobacteraceae bacterium]